jgi:hypothetical protein
MSFDGTSDLLPRSTLLGNWSHHHSLLAGDRSTTVLLIMRHSRCRL